MINKWFVICVCLISLDFSSSEISSDNVKLTYEQLYKIGVEAYLENRWKECVSLLEKALEDYFYYNNVLLKCRRKCHDDKSNVFNNDSENSSDMWRFQNIVTNRALCLMTCQNFYFYKRPKTSEEVNDSFSKKVPYNYLQLCYFKIDEPEKAASCAYTFLIHNPNHEVMLTNLQYYLALPNIKVEKIKYLEPKLYQDLFLKGAQLYTDGKYVESIQVMEASLKEYLFAIEDCRLLCEKPMMHFSSEELYVALSNHFTYSLRCKLRCSENLSYMYGQKHDDLFASYYHYLQFSYHKTQKHKEACSAVATFLLIHPDDKTMLSNELYYSQLPEVSKDWFVPRKEAEDLYHLITKEMNLLKAIEKAFQFNNMTEDSTKILTPPPKSPSDQPIKNSKRSIGKTTKKLSKSEASKWFKKSYISLLMNEKDLNGTKRVAFSGLATQNECQQLENLALEGGVYGDGYNGKQSPHTEFEMFEGLTITRATILAHQGVLEPSAAELFLNLSEKARQAVEIHFNLDTELYFAYTHLVCRTALPGLSQVLLNKMLLSFEFLKENIFKFYK